MGVYRYRTRNNVKLLDRVILYALYCTSDGETYTLMAMYKDRDLILEKKRILEEKVFRKCIVKEIEVK